MGKAKSRCQWVCGYNVNAWIERPENNGAPGSHAGPNEGIWRWHCSGVSGDPLVAPRKRIKPTGHVMAGNTVSGALEEMPGNV